MIDYKCNVLSKGIMFDLSFPAQLTENISVRLKCHLDIKDIIFCVLPRQIRTLTHFETATSCDVLCIKMTNIHLSPHTHKLKSAVATCLTQFSIKAIPIRSWAEFFFLIILEYFSMTPFSVQMCPCWQPSMCRCVYINPNAKSSALLYMSFLLTV